MPCSGSVFRAYLCNSILSLPYVIVYYIVFGLLLLFLWCPCMSINVNVQYYGGLLPDIILLTQGYFHRGTRSNALKRFRIYSLCPSKRFDIISSPLNGGCSEGLGAF